MLDFHTHILPSVDDGSSSAEESLKMLKALKEQGVDKVVLTPHFYAYASDIKSFLYDREKALDTLKERIRGENLGIGLYLGCEVLYFDEIWRIDDIKKLCIDGTQYMLVEMPFAAWTDSCVNGVVNLMSRGITPVIAHFDRYIKYQHGMHVFYDLINEGALLQMNCGYINRFLTRGKAISFLKKGIVSFIGTDCHNMADRQPNYAAAIKHIEKGLSAHRFETFKRKEGLLSGAVRYDEGK